MPTMKVSVPRKAPNLNLVSVSNYAHLVAYVDATASLHHCQHASLAGSLSLERCRFFSKSSGHSVAWGAVAFDREHALSDLQFRAYRKLLNSGKIGGDLLSQFAGLVPKAVEVLRADDQGLSRALIITTISFEAFACSRDQLIDRYQTPRPRFEVKCDDLSGLHSALGYRQAGSRADGLS